MKYIPFYIFMLCILFPSPCYIYTQHLLESHFAQQYAREIKEIYIGDMDPLLKGNITITDAVKKNIDSYINSKSATSWGLKVRITVLTKQGTMIYPSAFERNDTLLVPDVMEIASENYRLINEGLLVTTDFSLDHNTRLSNAILFFYLFLSILILFYYYRRGIEKAKIEDLERNNEIDRLTATEAEYTQSLEILANEREKLALHLHEIRNELEKEKIQAKINEDEMLNEIIDLEESIRQNINLQKKKQNEIDELKKSIERLSENRSPGGKQSRKGLGPTEKRFKALYKNIILTERAVKGFAALTEEMKIKAEEVIHRLNEDPSEVLIKRKVFGKKKRKTVQEVLFGHKGRLYFKSTQGKGIEIIAIGTKNTQTKDLEYIDNL